jgi:hypothetical protein
MSSGNRYLPFSTRKGTNYRLEGREDTSAGKSRKKIINPNNSNLGPNGKILGKEKPNDEYRPGRKRVSRKPKGESEILKWEVDEIRLRDNRPLSLKFSKKREISPKITQKKIYKMDKIAARMEEIKRELRDNMKRDVKEMKSQYNTFTHKAPSGRRGRQQAQEVGSQKYFSHNLVSQENYNSGLSRQYNHSPSPNSRVKIESRKNYLKQNINENSNMHQRTNSYNTNAFCSRESYYSKFAKEFNSRQESSYSPNVNYKSRVSDLSRDFSKKRTVVLTPKRKQLFEEFQKSKVK